MTRSEWLRIELVILWVAISGVGGYLLAKHFEPYQPGHERAINTASTVFNGISGGQP